MKVNVYADVVPHVASGWVAEQVVLGLIRAGVEVRVVALDRASDMTTVNQTVALAMGEPFQKALKVVVRPLVRLTSDLVEDAVVVTLWESDMLPKAAVTFLNTARAVIVPNSWLKGVFTKDGVRVPVNVARYGISDRFTHTLSEFPKRTVFLAAGRTAHGRTRKGIDLVVSAFLYAFPNEKDVVLQVKTHEDCPLPEITSSRVQIIQTWFDEKTLVRWYRQGLVFVSGATCEGWGLHQHEAMACGKPVIGVAYGGVMEYFDPPDNGYAVKHRLAESDLGAGRWAVPVFESLVEQMRFVYENPVHAFMTGFAAAKSVEALTLEAMQVAHAKEVCRHA